MQTTTRRPNQSESDISVFRTSGVQPSTKYHSNTQTLKKGIEQQRELQEKPRSKLVVNRCIDLHEFMAQPTVDNLYVAQNDDDFQEAPVGQNGIHDHLYWLLTSCLLHFLYECIGEMIMVLARGVGVLVAIVAILSWFMIMMLFRAALAWIVHLIGVTGVCAIVGIATCAAMKYGNISGKNIWTMLRYSCS